MPQSIIGSYESARPEALQVLLDASAMLLATSSQSALLSEILDLASKLFDADAYAVWRSYGGGSVWRAVATRGLSDQYRTEVTASPSDLPTEIRGHEDVFADASLRRYDAVYRAENIRSMLVVPFTLHGESAGTITFYWRSRRSFTELDRDYASALSNLSAAALTISELHEQNDREKGRLAFLAEASALLASSLDYETTLQQVARLAVPHIADWCTVHIVEDGVVNRLIVAHADPAMLDFAREYSERYPEEIRPDRGLGAVLRTGVSEFVPHITEEMVRMAGRDAEHLEMLLRLRITSSILVPLSARGVTLGAIRLIATGGTRFLTADDLQLAEDLARRAGAAIENAKLHRAVVEQENQLRLSHSAARMGSWTMDLRKQTTAWSPEFKALHHLPADAEATMEGGAALIHPDDQEAVLQTLERTLASKDDSLNMDHRALTPDGRVLWLQSRGRIVRDAEGKPSIIHGITIDVTESRLAENALRRTEKLAAAGRLAATVAHEVNNPLESLMNLVYLAQETKGVPEQAAAYLKVASEEINRMAHVVRQTLGFYRESVHPVEADLGPIVTEVLDLYRSRANARSVQLFDSAEPDLVATVNAGEIRQVLANLVSNAIDATSSGGSIRVTACRTAEAIEIRVKDSGTGIAEAHLPHVFEPFFTTKSDVGTGLGLWVSKGIIEKHHGTMVVTPHEANDPGVTMTITLPLR